MLSENVSAFQLLTAMTSKSLMPQAYWLFSHKIVHSGLFPSILQGGLLSLLSN